jgi:beta-N-acetylhexosaminidase
MFATGVAEGGQSVTMQNLILFLRLRFIRYVSLAAASLLCVGAIAGCATTRAAAPQQLPDWRSWPLERKIAQMLLLGFPGETITEGSPISLAIREYGVGGVVLFDNNVDLEVTDRNITGPTQLKKLTAALRLASATPLFIAVDQEGGIVARLKDRYGFPATVSAAYLGEKNDLLLTRSSVDAMAATLREYGFNLNLAPVVDLNTNPANPVIALKQRSYSGNPALVAAHAAEFIKSHHKQHIATCLKHFPGHGSSRDDSHLGLVDVTKYWNEDELLPYQSLIGQGLGDMVMTAHTFNTRLDPDYPATLSKNTIDGILRKRLGYDGVVVSDDLYMGAIIRHYSYETAVEKAINAGVDLLVVANDKLYSPDIAPRTIAMIREMVDSGRISKDRIDQACNRIMRLKGRYLFR